MAELTHLQTQVRNWAVTTGLASLLAAFVWSFSVIVGGEYALLRPLQPIEEALATAAEETSIADTLTSALEDIVDHLAQRTTRDKQLHGQVDATKVRDSLSSAALWDSVNLSALEGLPLTRQDQVLLAKALAALGAERKGYARRLQSAARDSLSVEQIASLVAFRGAVGLARSKNEQRAAKFARLSELIHGEGRAVIRRARAAAVCFPLSLIALNMLATYAFTGLWLPRLRKAKATPNQHGDAA